MAHNEKSSGSYGSTVDMKIVAASILIMGLSLAIIIIIWVSFGYIGPKFSDKVLREQQSTLRQQYGLPPAPSVSSDDAEIPPSERGLEHTITPAR